MSQGVLHLKFPEAPGRVCGFSTSCLPYIRAEHPAANVRELVQNALDAALVAADRDHAEVHFVVEDVATTDIPGIEGYRRALSSAKEYISDNEEQSKSIAGTLQKALDRPKVPVLFVIDNGIGLSHKSLGTLLSDGVSNQSGNQSCGSYGVGHLTAFGLSDLNYVIYGGVVEEEMLFSGRAILASHMDGNKVRSEYGYLVKKICANQMNHNRFSFYDGKNAPEFLRSKMESVKGNWGSGSVIAIMGFNDFDNNTDDDDNALSRTDIILGGVAQNFYTAIEHGKLYVEVRDGKREEVLDRLKLEKILEEGKDKRKGRNRFPSGQRIWASYQTLLHGERHEICTKHGTISLRLNRGGNMGRVALNRNGMWIDGNIRMLAPRDFNDRAPFDALLLVDAETSGEVHNLVKLAENPLHNQLLKISADKKTDKKLKNILTAIKGKISSLVEEKSDETWTPPNFAPIYFVEEGREPSYQSGSGGRLTPVEEGGDWDGESQGGSKRQPGERNPPEAYGPRSPERGRLLPFKVAGCYGKNQGHSDENHILLLCVKPTEDCADIEMQLSVDDGTDATCVGVRRPEWLPLRRVLFEDRELDFAEIPGREDKYTVVGIGPWKKDEEYHLTIEYQASKLKSPSTLVPHFSKAGSRLEDLQEIHLAQSDDLEGEDGATDV